MHTKSNDEHANCHFYQIKAELGTRFIHDAHYGHALCFYGVNLWTKIISYAMCTAPTILVQDSETGETNRLSNLLRSYMTSLIVSGEGSEYSVDGTVNNPFTLVSNAVHSSNPKLNKFIEV
ncbi:MAG: hypothetical protein EZS28_034140 [Streblomastix strix]|uniref:Uncharacterized protein n=1 Tax=Streblomastix strix TaxID=222440 RepID=A0A5J4UJD3_9EUKA|nr:MAG: hypothetical protein EZS28_034140 [Streblomastix strix]